MFSSVIRTEKILFAEFILQLKHILVIVELLNEVELLLRGLLLLLEHLFVTLYIEGVGLLHTVLQARTRGVAGDIDYAFFLAVLIELQHLEHVLAMRQLVL
jgi:hypothetical protein